MTPVPYLRPPHYPCLPSVCQNNNKNAGSSYIHFWLYVTSRAIQMDSSDLTEDCIIVSVVREDLAEACTAACSGEPCDSASYLPNEPSTTEPGTRFEPFPVPFEAYLILPSSYSNNLCRSRWLNPGLNGRTKPQFPALKAHHKEDHGS